MPDAQPDSGPPAVCSKPRSLARRPDLRGVSERDSIRLMEGAQRSQGRAIVTRALAPVVLGLLTGVLLWQSLSPAPSLAAATNCGSKAVHFDGASVYPTTAYMNLAEADIDKQAPELCSSVTTSTNSVVWWSMIAGRSPADAGWAQVGYLKNATSTDVVYFYQWMKLTGSTIHTDLFGSPATGSHTFTVARTNSASCLSSTYCLVMKVDGVASGLDPFTSFDPHLAWNSSSADFFGETAYPGSDVPGVTSNKARFRNVTEKDGPDVVHSSWVGTSGSDCPYWQWGNPNGAGVYTAFNIWTSPIDHGNGC